MSRLRPMAGFFDCGASIATVYLRLLFFFSVWNTGQGAPGSGRRALMLGAVQS